MFTRRFSKPFALMVVYLQLVAATPSAVYAQNLSVTARAEAGVDPATRQFIATLPSVWGPQIESIFDSLMKRTDVSVSLALTEIQSVISNAMSDAKCKTLAGERQMIDELVNRLPWVKTKEPIPKLREQIVSIDERRSYSSSPTEIKDAYNQIQFLTSVVKCEYDRVPTAQHDLNQIGDDYNRRWLVWNRLQSIECTDGNSCITQYKQLVEAQVRSTDADEAKDVKKSHADENFAKFRTPDGPGFLSYWTKSFKFDAFEQALADLYNIENTIYLARAVRLAEADNKLTDARSHFDAGHKLLGYECYIMSGSPGKPTGGDFGNAQARVPKITTDLDAAFSLANESVAIDRGHKDQAASLQSQIATDRLRLNKLATSASSGAYTTTGNLECR